jgi:hypothetical protein
MNLLLIFFMLKWRLSFSEMLIFDRDNIQLFGMFELEISSTQTANSVDKKVTRYTYTFVN